MNSSRKVARIAGIDISIHWTFLLLVGWVLFAGMSRGIASALLEVVLLLSLFACVLLHELGHAAAARYFGVPTHGITLMPIGGVANLDRIPRNPRQELVIALAGPAVNVFLVGLMLPLVALLSDLGHFVSPLALGSSLLSRLMWMNVALAVFNLTPAFPMDGGRVLRALLAKRLDYRVATKWARNV
ncbi:MAG: site-2 protease family protein, partial [Planctomycetales bacterium]|nr:site-2 protease family protein [Planctomycetales bacterium]